MADFKWKNIVRSAVRNARLFNNPHVSQSPYWFAVAELCGVGSSSAIELCEMFGMDPHAKMPGVSTEENASDIPRRDA